ncbi:transposase [Collinsella aerofaciens]|uniref:RNA-guided endonuclease InsQ/TnpB family protein n=1 Tax=Collinsella aerofaciens TaxID=74426 RepID=UPI001D03519F|nr:transposase [Collinsella aerofaciens]MCB5367072.1 transposase [Collinsella aerofaciens]
MLEAVKLLWKLPLQIFARKLSGGSSHWWVTAGIETDSDYSPSKKEEIGIDLGIKDLAVCSDGTVYKNINKTVKVKRLERKKRRLQRKISRKYEKGREGNRYRKTCNIIKSEKQLLKVSRRLTNIRHNYIHQITSEIVNRKPMFIVLEDLNVKGMMKNKHLAESVQQQCFYEFRRQMEYKSKWNDIRFILADRWFPSSKLCSCCGKIKKDLELSDRVFKCGCGNIIDRDYQASINLKKI